MAPLEYYHPLLRRSADYPFGRLRVLFLLATIPLVSPIPPPPSDADAVPRPIGLSQEPAGYAPILNSGFSNSLTDRWMLGTPGGTIQEVIPSGGAPGGQPGRVRVTYPAGWQPADDDVPPRFRQVLGGGTRNAYLSFWIALSPNWKAGPQGVDNVLTLRTKPAAPELRVTFMGVAGADLVPSLRLRGLHSPFQGANAPLLSPNLAPNATVRRGVWQHWELVFQGNAPGQNDGKLAWWLDGLPMGEVAGLEFWGPEGPRIRDVAWDLTAPAGGIAEQQRVSLDEMYLSAPAVGGDRIVLMNDREGGGGMQPYAATTVLLDANTGAQTNPCSNDLVVAGDAMLPNLLSAGVKCPPDEITVFSTDDAATIDGPAANAQAGQGVAQGIWQDVGGERRVESSRRPWRLQVVLWIAQEKDPRDRRVERIARSEVDLASTILNEQRAGIKLEVAAVNAVWDNSAQSVAGRAAMGCQTVLGVTACTCLPTLTSSPFFTAGKLNAYYVPAVFDNPGQPRLVNGLNCRLDHNNDRFEPNVVFMSISTKSPVLLAHEAGHGLALEHTVDGYGPWYSGVPDDNVMRDDTWLTFASVLLGQAFRMNVDSRSILRRNGLQTGPQRPCECELWVACPRNDFITESQLGVKCPPMAQAWP